MASLAKTETPKLDKSEYTHRVTRTTRPSKCECCGEKTFKTVHWKARNRVSGDREFIETCDTCGGDAEGMTLSI